MPLLLALCLPCCQTHVHRVGVGATGLGEETTRQFYALFGLVRLNDVDAQRLATDLAGYEIETRYSFLDMLLLPLLAPFTCTSRTVTVRK